jgi:hypothetical protein
MAKQSADWFRDPRSIAATGLLGLCLGGLFIAGVSAYLAVADRGNTFTYDLPNGIVVDGQPTGPLGPITIDTSDFWPSIWLAVASTLIAAAAGFAAHRLLRGHRLRRGQWLGLSGAAILLAAPLAVLIVAVAAQLF